ncbi:MULTISPECIES: LPS export ABC transporter periplasmic protein LptC [Gammaproteobacteria]|uniref:LPS export ABC transporter periplasmic protein LptC n=1 Tax=Gammaproteobacteria TaxID=1236 RepID=UPI001ADA5451|nr:MULTISPECIES: LPS export ABC transporter periplasmic protein LptC [Gammaproteobacteria]MBO9484428.1 LPS export ABC transporter periplasmic protein LptC [Salinisphaera sp. G21_0]MBO9494591.1 LPS export ABC transporter periplasmic protein LptC [Thalassotalea sp. G20_0]
MTYRNHLIIAAILLVLAAGYWTYDGAIVTVSASPSEIIRQDADYFLVDALVKEYDATGALQYQLQSGSITHYPHNDNTLLQQPILTNLSDSGQLTVSTSENGKLLPGGKDIELWDNVVVIQSSPSVRQQGYEQQLRMDTDFLTIATDKEIADTDRPVLITSDTGETQAIGMTAWYQQGKIQLKSRVRGVYETE